MLLTIGALVVVLGVLIFVHELGHFLVAKAVGVQVLRFSVGFGRPLVAWRWGETEYWISWIPLGGYVKMAGLEEGGGVDALEGGKSSVPLDPARAFDRQPLWARISVILAGVTMNALLALGIYAGLAAALGSPRLAVTQVDSVMVSRLPPGAESVAGLRFGDRIVAVNGNAVRTWDDISRAIVTGPPQVRLEIAGRPAPIVAELPGGDEAARSRLADALIPLVPPKVGLVEPGRPASRAGLEPGDLILRVNGDTIRSWSGVLQAVWHSPGKPLALDVLRKGAVVRLQMVPETKTETDSASPRPKVYGAIGAAQDPPTVYVRESLGRALGGAVRQTAGGAVVVVVFLKEFASGRRPLRELGGPGLVGQIAGQVARLGLDSFLSFLAFFSVQLAVLNLLPIPVLDGGQLLFLLAEAVLRRPLSLELRTRLTQIGLIVLLGIMLLAVSNDVLRFFH